MEASPGQVAIIGDDIQNDLGGGAKELGLHRFLGKNINSCKNQVNVYPNTLFNQNFSPNWKI